MTVKKLTPEELLGLNKFAVDEEEPHIVLDKVPDVVDRVLPTGDPLDPKAEPPAAVLFRVDFDRFQHVRMDHPAPAELDPALFVLKPDIDLR